MGAFLSPIATTMPLFLPSEWGHSSFPESIHVKKASFPVTTRSFELYFDFTLLMIDVGANSFIARSPSSHAQQGHSSFSVSEARKGRLLSLRSFATLVQPWCRTSVECPLNECSEDRELEDRKLDRLFHALT
ncbi:hypothetical protein FGO68_gene15039 [Halteria grandinella]|uniref:Uncharacterized protein n=1 Tax=Halteria grandinella TaxID=5974 RepID=A0A8J8NBG9_HALGN|nr:hypothetical protein FGO68_gene15039 [Halteria grandinella]